AFFTSARSIVISSVESRLSVRMGGRSERSEAAAGEVTDEHSTGVPGDLSYVARVAARASRRRAAAPKGARLMTTAAAPPEKPRAEDFLAIDRMLSDEERDIRDTVRAFVRDKVTPYVGDWFEEGTIPLELARELGALNVLGMHLEGYGCAGASATAYGLACMDLEAGDSGVRSLVSVQGSLAMDAIYRWGSHDQ